MRYRALDENGDYTFGRGIGNFLIDSPQTVVQSVLTRLRLLQGEWYLDRSEGTPWSQEILGKGTNKTYDLVIQTRVLQTKGVRSILQYQSQVIDRNLSIAMTIDTIYSTESVSVEVTF